MEDWSSFKNVMESNNPTLNNQLEKSFVFVLNPIDVNGELPIEVAPGHFFQKANTEHIKKIKELMNLCRTSLQVSFLPPLYEADYTKVPDTKQDSGWKCEPLSPDRWRYWVIVFDGTNAELEYIGYAASLLCNDLELGFTVLGQTFGEAILWHGQSLFSFFENQAMGQPAVSITVDELREIPENYNLIKNISPDHEHVTRAFRKFRDIRSLPRSSELVTIALFSIIESLITHSPKHNESADSLGHQIKTKLPLLRKRFQRELDYNQYFRPASEETLWSKLYNYRSCVVHGEEPSFANDLQTLNDRNKVLEFLKEIVKLLLLLSLREPVLLTDLKKC